jgi:hypothetical protein
MIKKLTIILGVACMLLVSCSGGAYSPAAPNQCRFGNKSSLNNNSTHKIRLPWALYPTCNMLPSMLPREGIFSDAGLAVDLIIGPKWMVWPWLAQAGYLSRLPLG